jgi:hypothetical protein
MHAYAIFFSFTAQGIKQVQGQPGQSRSRETHGGSHGR